MHGSLQAVSLKLDVGCGHRKPDGYLGMDSRPLSGVDTIHDIEVLPWPFSDGTFAEIRAFHVFEHLKPWLMIGIMNEAWRVLSVGGLLKISMPYPGSPRFWQDPTHVKAWNEVTARYFDPDYPNWYEVYTPKPWKIHMNRFATEGDIDICLEKRP